MLTAKQEKFVKNLIKGMSQREAYKNSYNAKNMKDKTIDNKASKLFKKDEVRARYEKLQEKAEDKAIMSAIERKKWLTQIINGEIKEDVPLMTNINSNNEVNTIKCPTKLDTRLKALDTLNKMDGEYTTKLEGSISVDKLEDLL